MIKILFAHLLNFIFIYSSNFTRCLTDEISFFVCLFVCSFVCSFVS